MEKTFIKYIIGGGLSYGLKIILTYLAVNFFNFWYFYAYLIALAIVIFFNFFINSFFIFKVRDFKPVRILKYLSLIVIFNAMDAGLVVFLTDKLFVYYLLSITISTCLVFILKFFVYKYFVFNLIGDLNQENINVFSSDGYLKEHGEPYLKEYEDKIVKKYFKPGMVILDLGCGAGRTTAVLDKLGYRVFGADVSVKLIQLAKSRYPQINFAVQDACQMTYPAETFDLVFFSFNGLDYIYPKANRVEAIKEIGRVLKSGGLFIYTSHNAFNFPRTKISLIIFWKNLLSLRIFTNYRLETHPMGNLMTYYGNLFEEIKTLIGLGFGAVEVTGVGKWYNNRNRILLSLFSKHLLYIFKKQ